MWMKLSKVPVNNRMRIEIVSDSGRQLIKNSYKKVDAVFENASQSKSWIDV